MKIITLSKIGYNHPSQANWSYGIWKLDLINTEDKYCMSYTLKENFGGDSRLKAQVKELFGIDIIETKAVYPTQKITGIKDIGNLEDDEILTTIKEFIKEQNICTFNDCKNIQFEDNDICEKHFKDGIND